MKNRLERHFFPFVIKPGRYAGGELGQIRKDHTDKIKFLYAIPSIYDFAQGDVVLSGVYEKINAQDEFLCERVYLPDVDAIELLENKQISLFSLESKTEIKEFDIIGFNLESSNEIGDIVSMLKLGGIDASRNGRNEDSPLIIIFCKASNNPLPLSGIADIVLLGDIEESLLLLLSIISENKEVTKQELLKQFNSKNNSANVGMLEEESNDSSVSKIHVASKSYSSNFDLIPLVDVVKSGLHIELGSNISEQLSEREIAAKIEDDIKRTGYEKLNFCNRSSIDFAQLLAHLRNLLTSRRISVSLPPFPISEISDNLFSIIKKLNCSPLHIYLEPCREKLRTSLKSYRFSAELILERTEKLFRENFRNITFQISVGSPYEENSEINETIRILKEIARQGISILPNINLSLVIKPFLPSPNSVFQWDQLNNIDEIIEKLSFYENSSLLKQYNIMLPDIDNYKKELLNLRGGKIACDVFAGLKGIDSIDFKQLSNAISYSKELPWTNIQFETTASELQKIRNSISRDAENFVLSNPKQDSTTDSKNKDAHSAFGRKNKRVVSKSALAPTRNRIRIKWKKDSRYKYMSHLDNVRLMERVVRKAELPVSYNNSDRPSMKFALATPLPLGFTSEIELLDLTLDYNIASSMIENLEKWMPAGTEIIENKVVFGKSRSLSASLNRAIYSVPFEELGKKIDLQKRIDKIINQDIVEFERESKDKIATVNLRTGIFSLELETDDLLMTLGLGTDVYVKPVEVLKLLCPECNGKRTDQQCMICEYLKYKLHRLDLYRDDENGNKTLAMDL